jgi:hypothetical protein
MSRKKDSSGDISQKKQFPRFAAKLGLSWPPGSRFPSERQWAFAEMLVLGGMTPRDAYARVYPSRRPEGRSRQVSANLACRLLHSAKIRWAIWKLREKQQAVEVPFSPDDIVKLRSKRIEAEVRLTMELREQKREQRGSRTGDTSRRRAGRLLWEAQEAIETAAIARDAAAANGHVAARSEIPAGTAVSPVVPPLNEPAGMTGPHVTEPAVEDLLAMIRSRRALQAERLAAESFQNRPASVQPRPLGRKGHWETYSYYEPGHFPPRRRQAQRWVEDRGGEGQEGESNA